jgi:hypothetical protein
MLTPPPIRPLAVQLPVWFWPVFAVCFGLLLHACSYVVDRVARKGDTGDDH